MCFHSLGAIESPRPIPSLSRFQSAYSTQKLGVYEPDLIFNKQQMRVRESKRESARTRRNTVSQRSYCYGSTMPTTFSNFSIHTMSVGSTRVTQSFAVVWVRVSCVSFSIPIKKRYKQRRRRRRTADEQHTFLNALHPRTQHTS